MGVISRELLAASADAYDASVAPSAVDGFCSSFPWIDAALTAFSPRATPLVIRTDAGWAPLAVRSGPLRWAAPWEASWGLSAAVVGADGEAAAGEVVDELLAVRDRWDALYLSGLARHGAVFGGLVRRLGRRFRLGVSNPTVRCVASLDGGPDGFLSRRTPKFRKSLRAAERAAAGTIRFDVERSFTPAQATAAFSRLLDVEAASWKGQEGVGITDGPMRTFYAAMIPHLAERDRLRLTWATVDGKPAGYVLGGLFGDTYRGLQFSFDQAHAHRSIGNLMQWATLRDLCAEGVVRYDLGTEMEYKLRWAEQRVETVALVVR